MSSTAENRTKRRRGNLEARLTSDCGTGEEKQKLIKYFWCHMWPCLQKLGWIKLTCQPYIVECTGYNDGAIYFVPKGVDPEDDYYVKGEDYYDRIRDVIDRVCSYDAPSEEVEVANSYYNEIGLSDSRKYFPTVPPRQLRRSQSTKIDLSWKYGGTAFPKASSRVGDNYQAPNIPDAGTFSPEDAKTDPDLQYDEIWNYKRAEAAGALNFIHERIKYNKKEAAIIALHNENYQTRNLADIVHRLPVHDGSDWTKEQRERFREEIFRSRKNIVAVAKSTGRGNNATYAYYLGKFKKSDDYRLLKTICKQEKLEKINASKQGLDACGICGKGGSLLICDGCEGEFHMACLTPPLINIPEGSWYCDSCVDKDSLGMKDTLMQTSYEHVDHTNKKRKQNFGDFNSTSGKSANPSDEVTINETF